MAPVRNAVESYFDKFATSTVIRVFSFIRTAPFLVERLFWATILVGFTSLTVYNVYITIDTFAAEPAASHVSFPAAASTGLNYSNAVICFSFRSSTLLKLYDTANASNEIIDRFTQYPNVVQYLEKKLAAFYAAEEHILPKPVAKSRNMTVLAQTQVDYNSYQRSLGEVFSRQDLTIVGLTTALLSSLVEFEQTSLRVIQYTQSRSLTTLYRLYVNKRVNFVDLMKLIGEVACAVQQVRMATVAWGADGTFSFSMPNLCKDAQKSIIWFGYSAPGISELVCYRTPMIFFSALDPHTISAHPEALYRELTSELQYILIDLTGTFAMEKQPPFLAVFNDRQRITFSPETVSTSLNLRRRRCLSVDDRKGTHGECLNWCRSEAIVKACNCTALMSEFTPVFEINQRNRQSCAIGVGAEFGNVPTIADEVCRHVIGLSDDELAPNCSQRCYPNCETVLFSYAVRPLESSHWSSTLGMTTVVDLRAVKFVYQQVDEKMTMGWKELVASLGGNLSLYMGASFLALIHILVFCVKLPFDVFGQRHSSTMTSSENVPHRGNRGSTMKNSSGDAADSRLWMHIVRLEKHIVRLEKHIVELERKVEFIDLDRKLLRGALLLRSQQLP